MTKSKPPRPALGSRGKSIIVLCLVTAATVYLVWPKKSITPTTNNAPTTISITTPDGVALAATLTYPDLAGPVPAVILLHEYGRDRHQWDTYISTFTQAGFAVLNFDLRGFGDSRLKAIPASQAEHLKSAVADVPAVVDYLQHQSRINRDRLSLIGSSIGANIAFVANGNGLSVNRTVLLSPTIRDGMDQGYGAENFSPSNILGVASETEKQALEAYLKSVTGVTEEKIIPGSGHGIALLSQPDLLEEIIQWIK